MCLANGGMTRCGPLLFGHDERVVPLVPGSRECAALLAPVQSLREAIRLAGVVVTAVPVAAPGSSSRRRASTTAAGRRAAAGSEAPVDSRDHDRRQADRDLALARADGLHARLASPVDMRGAQIERAAGAQLPSSKAPVRSGLAGKIDGRATGGAGALRRGGGRWGTTVRAKRPASVAPSAP